jgi:hypothetical protein
MAWRSKQNVHICAPSNAAIDEILSRINAKGLIGLTHFRGTISKEIDYDLSNQNLEAPAFNPSEEDNYNFDYGHDGVQLRDIILRMGAEEYKAPEHLKPYSFTER